MTRRYLSPFALRVWLKRRERRLILEERAALQAALDGATPEERTRLQELLRPGRPPASAT